VLKAADALVTVSTQQTTDFAGTMAVINVKAFLSIFSGFCCVAYSAFALLRSQKSFVLRNRHSIQVLDTISVFSVGIAQEIFFPVRTISLRRIALSLRSVYTVFASRTATGFVFASFGKVVRRPLMAALVAGH